MAHWKGSRCSISRGIHPGVFLCVGDRIALCEFRPLITWTTISLIWMLPSDESKVP